MMYESINQSPCYEQNYTTDRFVSPIDSLAERLKVRVRARVRTPTQSPFLRDHEERRRDPVEKSTRRQPIALLVLSFIISISSDDDAAADTDGRVVLT